MELKHYSLDVVIDGNTVLIVPSGIETILIRHIPNIVRVLIVPSGIETLYLLIVRLPSDGINCT